MLGRVGDPRAAADLTDSNAWVEVPAGKYQIGDAGIKEEYGGDKGLTPETVTFAHPFQLTKYPVTNEQFRRFMESGGYNEPSLWHETGWRWREENSITEPAFWQTAKWNGRTQPVVGVSWWEADAFCRWAGCRSADRTRVGSRRARTAGLGVSLGGRLARGYLQLVGSRSGC